MGVVGILLAAGGGSRLAGDPNLLAPKALVTDERGLPWVARVAGALVAGGCEAVLVVTGAAAGEVESALAGRPRVDTVRNERWRDGLGTSLRTGLAVLPPVFDAALVALVDMPGLAPAVVERLVARATPQVLARASYSSAAGHPVLIGRDHWAAARREADGDRGARTLLAAATLVECGDLDDGLDVDVAAHLPPGHTVTHRAAPTRPGPGAAGAG